MPAPSDGCMMVNEGIGKIFCWRRDAWQKSVMKSNSIYEVIEVKYMFLPASLALEGDGAGFKKCSRLLVA
jgi:hypothetical protein